MKKFLTMFAFAVLLVPLGARAQNSTLTVCDGTANHQYVPFYGFYADEDQHNQLIYPADSLTAMVGNAITQMVFYIDQSASNGSSTAASHLGTWTVSLGITSDTTLSGLDMTTPVAQVYEGYFDCSTGALTLEFESAFMYNGGNLLVDLQHEAAGYNRWYFLGVSATGASYCYDSQRDFLPKVTFTYGEAPSCFRVQSITASNIESSSMTLTWFDPNNESTTYTLWYTDGGTDTSYVYSISDTTYDITNLTPLTVYYFGVTPDCDATLAARTGNARTLLYCENGACMITVRTYAEYSYTDYYPTVHVFQNGSELGSVFGNAQTIGVCSGDSVVFIYEEPYSSYYTPYVSIQDGAGTTLFDGATDLLFDDDTVFVTTNPCPSCIPPANLTAVVDDEGNATITWNTGDASQWNLVWGAAGFIPDTVSEDSNNYLTVSDTTYEILNLETGIYTAYVRTLCSDGDTSAWASVPINVGIYIMAANSTDTLRTCSSIIYDDGGLDGNYANNQTTTLVVMPNAEGQVVVINGTSNTETTWDYLTIYDGVGTTGEVVFRDNVSGVYTTAIPTLMANAFTIVFQTDGSGVYGGFAINVSCQDAPTCPRPTEFAVDSTTATEAYLSWEDETGTTWTVEYGPAGFTRGGSNSQFADFSSNANAVITGLTPGTFYDFYLMSICGVDTSWALSATAFTNCAPMPVPFAENFQSLATGSSAAFHPCWSKGTNYSYTSYPYVSTDPLGTNGKSLYFYASGTSYSYVVLPEFDNTVNLNTLEFTFDLLNNGSYAGPTIYVAALDSTVFAPATPFDTLAAIPLNNSIPTGEWSTQVVDFSNYTGTNRRIALILYPTSSYAYIYVDNINVHLLPSCARPDSITISGVTTNSLTVDIAGLEGNNYRCLLTDVNADEVVDSATVTTLSHTFTGLTPATKYTVSVSNVCSDGTSTIPLYATTYTECVAISELPYTQNFEDYTASSTADFDPCWSKGATNGSMPYVADINNSKRLYFYTYYNYDYNYAILPELDESIEINTLELSFDAHKYDYESYTGHFIVGLIDGDTYTAETPIDTIQVFNLTNTTPETQYVSFGDYTGTNRRIVFVVTTSGSTVANYLYLDNVNLHLLPQCLVPTNLAVDSITANSATFSWNGSADNYEYLVMNGNTIVENDTISSTEVTVNGLAMDNDYTIKVRSICEDAASAWTNTISIHIGYCSPSASSCDGQGITNVTFGIAPEVVNNNNRPTSTPFYRSYASQIGGVYAGTTANVDITYSTSYTYGTIIWVDWNNNMSFEGNEVVYVGESGSASPTTLNASFVVPATQDTGYYRMRIAGADSYFDSYITSIAAAAAANPCYTGASYAVAHDYTLHVMPAPDCMAPVALTATGLTDNSISVSFMGSDETDYQVSINNAAGTVACDTTTDHTYTFTGLTASTSYTIYVAAICAGALTDSASLTVSTTVAGAPLPYSTGFETTDDTAWTFVNGIQSNMWYIDTAVNHGGSQALYISSDSGAHNTYAQSTSMAYVYKTFTFAESQYAVSFDWKATGESNYDYLRAFLAPASVSFTAGQTFMGGTATYSAVTATPAGWIDLGGKMNLSSTWQTSENVVEMPAAGNYHLVFFWGNDGSGGSNPPAAIDNVSIQVITCVAPDSLDVTNITSSSATLSWVSRGEESSWIISLNGHDTIVNTNPAVINGLEAGAYYQARVRAICGAGDTSFALTGSFVSACPTAYSVPYIADFATPTLSPCWIDTATITASTWAQSVENGYGINYGYIFSRTGYTNQNGNDWLISPVINIPTDTDFLNLAFMVAGIPYNTSNSNYNARYAVYVSPTGGSNFADFTDTLIVESLNSNYFERKYFSMGAYAGQNIRVAFRNMSYYAGAIYLANIGIRYTNEPVYGVYGSTSAYVGDTISWKARRFEGDTTSMTLSWSSTMAAAGQGTLLNGTTDSASMIYTAAGIDTMTFIATNSYGADTVRWTVNVFNLNPVSVFPYTTSFETTDADNYSWILRNGENAWTLGTATSNDGTQSLYISNDNGATNFYEITAATVSYASRAFNIATPGDYTIGFDWKAEGESNYDYLRAFFVPDAQFNVSADEYPGGITSSYNFFDATITGWIDLGGKLNQSTSWTREEDSINITTPGRYHLVFVWSNDNSMGSNPPVAIDNIVVNNGSAPIICDAPVIDSVLAGENDIFVSFTGADDYEVAIAEGLWNDSVAAAVTPVAVADTFYTFTDLTAETQYTIGVRAICGTGIYSEWVTLPVMTLMHPCAKPTNVQVSNVTLNSAVIDWTPGEEETEWELNITGTNYDHTFAVNSENKPYTVTGLANNQTYFVKVRAICSENRYSDWSDTTNFTTATCQPVSNLGKSNITAHSATISWNAPSASVENFEIEYGLRGFNQGSGTLVTVNGAVSYNLTGLLEETAYDVYVRSVCAENAYSTWSAISVTTLAEQQGIEDVDNASISLYPNPASSTVTLTGIAGMATVTVVDMNGRVSGEWTVNDGTLTIDVTSMAQGAYFVRIVGEQVNAIRKLIVR